MTGWLIGGPTKSPEFVITSGQVYATAPTSSDSSLCIGVSFPAGTVDPSTGVFTAKVYTLVPASPGNYQLSGYGLLPANSQASVSVSLGEGNPSLSSITVSPSQLSSILANPPVSMNRNIFLSTVPTYTNVGENYTVMIVVSNTAQQPIPVLFRLEPPINAMTVHPIYVQALVPPHGQVIGNFTIVPFNSSYQGTINMTAMLYIWYYNQMSNPALVQQLSTSMYGINPYRHSYAIQIFLVSLVIVPSFLALGYYKIKFK